MWTSTAQLCNLGMLIARTDPNLPKHKGITYFKFDMTQPGVEIRPLREMTGRAMFNEVFIDNARVHDDDMIGGLNNGWAVANTTLMAERAGLGTGGSGARAPRSPARSPSQLDNRVGDHVGQVRTGGTGGGGRAAAQSLIEAGEGARQERRPGRSARSSRSSTRCSRSAGCSALRMKSRRGRTGGEPNIAKLMMSDLLRLQRDVGNEIIGAVRHGAWAATRRAAASVQEITLFSPGPSIYGGTDQVQRNIIGERVLGLPEGARPGQGHAVQRAARQQ